MGDMYVSGETISEENKQPGEKPPTDTLTMITSKETSRLTGDIWEMKHESLCKAYVKWNIVHFLKLK